MDKMDTEKRSKGDKRVKGRGFGQTSEKEHEERYSQAANFEVIGNGEEGAVKSIEGYIIFVSGVHEEATEDDLLDKFSEFGEVKNLHLPLDRRTGFVKGYALLEYATAEEADNAIKGMDATDFMDKKIHVDWAFSHGGKK